LRKSPHIARQSPRHLDSCGRPRRERPFFFLASDSRYAALAAEIKWQKDSVAWRNLQKKNKVFLTPVGTIPDFLALSSPAQFQTRS
jgi:hypothetical protein